MNGARKTLAAIAMMILVVASTGADHNVSAYGARRTATEQTA